MVPDKILIPRNEKLIKYRQDDLVIFKLMKNCGFIYFYEIAHEKDKYILAFSDKSKNGFQVFIIHARDENKEEYQFKYNIESANCEDELLSTKVMDKKQAAEFLADQYYLIKTAGLDSFKNTLKLLLGNKKNGS